MSPRFYSRLWMLYAAVFTIVWLAGYLSMFALVVFGFIAFGMVFTGMMCVLPAAVGMHAGEVSSTKAGPVRLLERRLIGRVVGILNRWFVPAGVEIRRPRFP